MRRVATAFLRLAASSAWFFGFAAAFSGADVSVVAPRRDDRGRSSVGALTALDDEFADAERVFAISDLHTDYEDNLAYLEELCDGRRSGDADVPLPGPKDVLIVAGDVSHDLSVLHATLSSLVSGLSGCRVLFVPGNHEAWTGGGVEGDSLRKLRVVEETCAALPGVHTVRSRLVGSAHDRPAWIVPLRSWYDGTLSYPRCEDLCADFVRFPWSDFVCCDWPGFEPYGDAERGRIPRRVAEHFLETNERRDVLGRVREDLRSRADDDGVGVLTFSHFLPNRKTLPDWKDVDDDVFRREEWFDHGAESVAANFAKVAGTRLLDEQLRSVTDFRRGRDHVHVFGHSHMPKDVTIDGIRYVHNPLGKQKERNMNLVSKDVGFQLLWDTRSGEVEGERVVRYWEEKGGGLDALFEYRRKEKERREMSKIRWRKKLKENQEQTDQPILS